MSAFIIRAYQVLAYVGFVLIFGGVTGAMWFAGENLDHPEIFTVAGLIIGLILGVGFAGIAITLIDTRNQLVKLNTLIAAKAGAEPSYAE
jgi:hypothetical protein